MTKADYPDLDLGLATNWSGRRDDPLSRGGSAIVAPLGDYLAGPLWDEAGILYGDARSRRHRGGALRLRRRRPLRRPDIFSLTVQPPPAVTSLLKSPLFTSGLLNPLLIPHDDFFADLDDDLEPLFGRPAGDPFFGALPAAFTEKKGPARTPPKHPQRRRKK